MGVSLELLDQKDSQGRNLWRLLGDYRAEVGPGCTIVVPKGYVTNFGTVPRSFYRLVTPAELREASIVHDWLCNEHFDGNLSDSGYSRWMADAVLYESMKAVGVGGIRRVLVWLAVRGWAWWKGIK